MPAAQSDYDFESLAEEKATSCTALGPLKGALQAEKEQTYQVPDEILDNVI